MKTFMRFSFVLFVLWLFFMNADLAAQSGRAMTFQDVMQFRAIKSPVLSEDGAWVAYAAVPDRGDGELIVRETKGKTHYSVERGAKPKISADGKWVAAELKPPAEKLLKSKKKKPKSGMALLSTGTGAVQQFQNVKRFIFSNDGRWLAIHFYAPKEENGKKEGGNGKKKGKRKAGTALFLRNLNAGENIEIPYVLKFAFDSTSSYFAYAVADTAGKNHGLFVRELQKENAPAMTLTSGQNFIYSNLQWSRRKPVLAYVEAEEGEDGKTAPGLLWVWDAGVNVASLAIEPNSLPENWIIPSKNHLSWTRDGNRLFFGIRPKKEATDSNATQNGAEDLYDTAAILKKKEVDVWHWNDPLINPHQKKIWKKMQDTTYVAVHHFDSNETVVLGDLDLPRVIRPENPNVALGITNIPYQKEITWVGNQNDIYRVDLRSGARTRVAERLRGAPVSLAPGGNYLVFYRDGNWHLHDCERDLTINLTAQLPVPFYNEDHDYPFPAPGYGVAGWVQDDAAVLIYDKYDIWQFPTDGGEPLCLTGGQGREKEIIFRIRKLDKEKRFYQPSEELLLLAYDDNRKTNAIYRCRIGAAGVTKIFDKPKRLRLLAKAKNADVILFTQERYDEFPDLWVTNSRFKSPKRVSNLGAQLRGFAWGKAERVEWRSLDGIPLQGVLIKPGNYQKGKRYPVIVYFYRFFSQRLHEFNQPVVNHRPCFPLYASNGYAIFLPDIRFEVGQPGFAATKSLVPGVQKLIDMGIADPERIGLHGHSWSGYQAAFIITQTDIFACAVAGAPVSNMTSAYSGIRWGSGLARQFQYEQSQSRIGGSLWEALPRYIENSPVFFADRIHTPLLIMFGDEDGAVPWYQGIELYLAMRRLGKDCVFLEYRGEPHHLKKYPNKLDYAIRMKQYFDHYLKGEAAAEWIVKGEAYSGK